MMSGSFRRLYLYQCDLTETAWYQADKPAPRPALPARLTTDWLKADTWRSCPHCFPFPPEIAQQRFEEHALCYAIWDGDREALIYHLWLSASGSWINWIGARLVPPARHCLIFDAWVHPDWRGHELHLHGAAAVCDGAVALGLPRIIAGVEYHEVIPFARMYARLGLGLIEPYEVLVHEEGPQISHHHLELPERELVEACCALRRKYRHHFKQHPDAAAS